MKQDPAQPSVSQQTTEGDPLGARLKLSFATIVLGQTVSTFGSSLTAFVLGVWVYQETGSVLQFSLITFFSIAPQLVALPFAGVLVDRWNRRWAMLLADTGAGLSTLILFGLISVDRLGITHLYLLVATSAIFGALQGLAFSAATPLLVPAKSLPRANGLVELSFATSLAAAPTAAGFLLGTIGLTGVILIDVTTFLCAAVTLLISRVPDTGPAKTHVAQPSGLWRQMIFGWSYIRKRKGLLALLLLFAVINFIQGMVVVLLTPLVLGFASPIELGAVMSTSIGGLLAGGACFTLWGGPQGHHVRTILACLAIQGTALLLGGLRASVTLVATVAFIYMFFQAVILACSRTIWQSLVDPAVQGRVFAVRRLVVTSARPLAFLLAGPLADRLFEPWMEPGGALAGSIGAVLGVGQGRGIGLFFMCMGLAALAALAVSFRYRPLLELDRV